jgi:2-polyprenyl-3-methyl-5-hydroxy-6-metoxy-1,4-benzoquinol methylase
MRGYDRAYLVRCGDCDLVFAQRRPSGGELQAYYGDYGHDWYDSPITRRRYSELLDSFEPYRRTNRILDFGCGPGFFLEEARRRGWEAHGTEFSEYALEITRSKNLDVVPGALKADTYGADAFDVITAFEVFEHLRDPLAEAAVLAATLRRGGLLYCTTPNFDAASRRLLRSRWDVIEYPEHLCYFTPRTLPSWLGRAGFVARAVASTGVSFTRLSLSLASKRSVLARSNSSACMSDDERVRAAIEHSYALQMTKKLGNGLLSGLGAGDTLKGRFELPASGASGQCPR